MHMQQLQSHIQHKPRVCIRPGASPLAVDFVTAHLRSSDQHEARCFGTDFRDATHRMVAHSPNTHTAYFDGAPAFVWGTIALTATCHQLFGFGTNDTRRVVPAITRFGKASWIPRLYHSGVRRVQVHVPQSCIESIRWLTTHGMRHECAMPDYSVNGDVIHQYAFSRESFEHVLFVAKATSHPDHASAHEDER